MTGIELLATLLAGVAANAIALLWSDIAKRFFGKESETTPAEMAQQRVDKLTAALREAVAVIAEIEHEIRVGHDRAVKLQQEIATYENTAKLTKEQSDAVSAVLAAATRQGQKKAYLINFVMGLFFFLLGAGVSLWLSH